MTRITHAEVRRIIQWATGHGWTYEGMNNRSHHRIRYEDGQAVTLPGTPSDNRGLLNTLAEIRRICGQLPHKPNAGHYRHVSQRGPRFSMDEVLAERARREEERERVEEHYQTLQTRHAELQSQLRGLIGQRITDENEERARAWIREALRIERACHRAGFPVSDPLDKEA